MFDHPRFELVEQLSDGLNHRLYARAYRRNGQLPPLPPPQSSIVSRWRLRKTIACWSGSVSRRSKLGEFSQHARVDHIGLGQADQALG